MLSVQGTQRLLPRLTKLRVLYFIFPYLCPTYDQGCSGVGAAFPHLVLAWERVPTPFYTIVMLLEDSHFSFQFLRVADCETTGAFTGACNGI